MRYLGAGSAFIAKREAYETRPPTGQCHGFVVASVALLLPRVRM
jgi:hypothetical protein